MKLSIFLSLWTCGILATPAAMADEYDPSWYSWTKHPWELRYVILISPTYPILVDNAKKANLKRDQKRSPEFRRYESLFAPTYPLAHADKTNRPLSLYAYKDLGFQVIEFNPEGRVLSPNSTGVPLTAHQTVVGRLYLAALLVEGDGKPGDNWYRLGGWFQGFPADKGREFSPAFCNLWDDGRYGLTTGERLIDPKAKFNPREVAQRVGLVGCREWTYQLYRPATLAGDGGQPPKSDGTCNSKQPPADLGNGRRVCEGLAEFDPKAFQPYIDVTTTLDKQGKQTFIGNVLGWARFSDPPRPVIGKHGDYWVCLHECPDGEAPGVIPDIRAWTAKRGWPMPKPVPYFPNSKFPITKEDLED